jgi:NADPH:quinone reductase-like Zn-dependent oxidoreductase
MLDGRYPVEIKDQGIPTSDCAAEVVDKGSQVERFAVGDRVSVICDLANLVGTERDLQAIGANVDGVLRDYAIYNQVYLFPLPNHLSWEEVCLGTLRLHNLF